MQKWTRHLAFLAPAVWGLGISSTGLTAQTQWWEGIVEAHGDSLHVRLQIEATSDSTALLDVPDNWYAGVPVPARRLRDGSLEVRFPGGIGTVELREDGGRLAGVVEEYSVTLRRGSPPPFDTEEVRVGAVQPLMEGTLYLPHSDAPVPAVILVAGSGPTTRAGWSYRSKADWYARMGIAALVYDRRSYSDTLPSGEPADFWSHADDIAAARDLLGADPRISPQIGLDAHSQGVWLSLLAEERHSGFDFLVLSGAPAVTPGDQQLQLLVTGMRDDGVPEEEIAEAVAYQRLLLSVAHFQTGWDALVQAMVAAEGTRWGSYMDRPDSLQVLDWWHRHLNVEPRGILSTTLAPMLVMTGERDWLTPARMNHPLYRYYAQQAGNARVVTMLVSQGDHRLARPSELDENGRWRFFGIHPTALDAIPRFLRETVGLDFSPGG